MSDQSFPKMKGMDVTAFEKQIVEFKNRGRIITYTEFVDRFVTGQESADEETFLLTFDDGLKDSYNFILPILTKHGATGLFNLITKAIDEDFVPLTHKVHYLLGTVPLDDLIKLIVAKHLEKYGTSFWDYTDETKARMSYRWDTDSVKMFKWTLNFGLPTSVKEWLIKEAFNQYFSTPEVSNELFLNWEEVRELSDNGCEIGGHTHSHANLGVLSEQEQLEEIKTCDRLIRQHAKYHKKGFSYPFGKQHNYSGGTIELLKSFNYSCAFSNIQPERDYTHFHNLPYEVPRLDPKDIH